MKGGKTNAMRILDQMRMAYTPHSYENPGEPKSGVAVAEELGVSAGRIFKTLVTHAGADYYVFVIPADKELDLKKAARACGAKKIEMLPLKELFLRTGYHKGGCSPLGMKKDFPTFIDRLAEEEETVFVSAGKVGQQIEIRPADLRTAVGGEYAHLHEE
ncbi:MAG: Cys-tRNA(Pro) deacylase [Peptoniphilaceae bacterium]